MKKEKSLFLSERYPLYLLIITIIIFGITAINPPYPKDFIYEHIMTVIFIFFIIFSYRKFKLSNLSYTFIFIFMILHIIGARFTYSEVPYNEFIINYFGFDLDEFFGFTRNHYDRLVHFSFGLFLAYPIREVFMRIANTKGIWSFYLPLDVVMAFSMIYELIEYGFVLFVAEEVSHTYLGTQGDVWDAHKDMFLATLGGFITLTLTFLINLKYKGMKILKGSFKVYRKTPLGEVELLKMMKAKN